jgi:hypothetical protein
LGKNLTNKQRLIIIIIADAIIFAALAMAILIDRLVNGTLYYYGLQYNVGWGSTYSIYFDAMVAFFVVSIALVSVLGVPNLLEKGDMQERIGLEEKSEVSASTPKDSPLPNRIGKEVTTGFWASQKLPLENDVSAEQNEVSTSTPQVSPLHSGAEEKGMTGFWASQKLPLEKNVSSAVYCRYCGFENDPDAVFCQKCGKSLSRKNKTFASTTMEPNPEFFFCGNCGTKNRATVKYCKKCGQPLSQ